MTWSVMSRLSGTSYTEGRSDLFTGVVGAPGAVGAPAEVRGGGGYPKWLQKARDCVEPQKKERAGKKKKHVPVAVHIGILWKDNREK